VDVRTPNDEVIPDVGLWIVDNLRHHV
jgi:hypothetical protein